MKIISGKRPFVYYRRVSVLIGILTCILSALACTYPLVQPLTATPVIPTTEVVTIITLFPPTERVTAPPTNTPRPTPTPGPTATATPTVPTNTPTPTETLVPTLDGPYSNMQLLFNGVCFDYLQSLSKKTLLFDNQSDLSDFYRQVDESKKCIERVPRQTFDFSSQQLIGTVVKATGCSLYLTYNRTDQNDSNQLRTIMFTGHIVGDCPYDLLYPVLLAVKRPSSNYTTQITVSILDR